ncbi:ATP-dependent RNA helicase A [Hyalella azteca]|uniref:ATP-dependent RNA helicase A n=1 Tax=Hyalella azteca TaxID=294128 RepID=A0A8B7N905_HYAAZ|nr:ATP-dependent RNA helicase A [Hyalella azteca]
MLKFVAVALVVIAFAEGYGTGGSNYRTSEGREGVKVGFGSQASAITANTGALGAGGPNSGFAQHSSAGFGGELDGESQGFGGSRNTGFVSGGLGSGSTGYANSEGGRKDTGTFGGNAPAFGVNAQADKVQSYSGQSSIQEHGGINSGFDHSKTVGTGTFGTGEQGVGNFQGGGVISGIGAGQAQGAGEVYRSPSGNKDNHGAETQSSSQESLSQGGAHDSAEKISSSRSSGHEKDRPKFGLAGQSSDQSSSEQHDGHTSGIDAAESAGKFSEEKFSGDQDGGKRKEDDSENHGADSSQVGDDSSYDSPRKTAYKTKPSSAWK